MYKRFKPLLTVCLLIIGMIGLAHEFWLQPNKYYLSKNDLLSIRFLVGKNFTGENWKGNRNKVQQLIHYLPDNKQIDISSQLSENIEGDSLELQLQQDGTHVIAFNSTNSFINLNADGSVTHSWISSGKVKTEESSDGYYFMDRATEKLVRVTGNVIITVAEPGEKVVTIKPYTKEEDLNSKN